MKALRGLLLGAAGAALVGCTGNVLPSNGTVPPPVTYDPNGPNVGIDGGTRGDGGGVIIDPPSPESFAFSCSPESGVTPSTLTRRLTSGQYRSALRAILQDRLGGQFQAVWAEALDSVERTPEDLPSTLEDYRRMSQGVDQSRVEAWFGVGQTVAIAATSNDGRLASLTNGCAANPNRGCVESFVRSFGQAAFRRPLADDEVAFLVDEVFDMSQPTTAGWRDLVTTILNSPDFLYVFEAGEGSGSARRLTGLELASRMALHFWGSGPDDELMQVALEGGLENEAVYAEQVRRLARDPRARESFDEFVTDWLQLWRRPDPSLVTDRADFVAYAGTDFPSATLLEEARQELLDLVYHFTFVEPSTIDVLMTTRAGFARSTGLARLYGLETPWTPGQPPLQLPAERAGIMTRVGMLLNDQATTRPILRGAAVRKRLLCDQLGLPANMDGLRLTEADDHQTTRQAIESLTMQDDGGCKGCHQLLNPPGFILEAFDGLGRHRDRETVFSAEGELLAQHPLALEVDMLVDGMNLQLSGPREMAVALAGSHQVRACFARQYVRFTFGRLESVRTDGCVLESVRQKLEAGATLREVFEDIALEDAFRTVAKS